MKMLGPVGKFGTSWWANVRPLLIVGVVTLTPAVLCLPLVGLFAGAPIEGARQSRDIAGWLLGAILLPLGFALFMGSWCFMWGIVIDRQLKRK